MMKILQYSILIFLFIACNKTPQESKTANNQKIINTEKVTIENSIDLETEENKLLKINNQLIKALSNLRNDSLVSLYSIQFSDSLIHLITNNDSTLNYSFKKLQKENALNVITSLDKKLRVYSWDNNSGGTMRFFNQIFQYDTNGKTKVDIRLATEDPQSFFSKIFNVQTTNNETVYLVISNSILSNKYSIQHIHAYKIIDEILQSAPVFKTKTNTLNKISVEYDFFSVVDRPERPVELITLDQNILKIPLVNENQKVLNKHLIYEWNGQYFIYKHVK